ncbi:MAG: hypothetical protein K1X39_09355 [Thermoflexales bacterium]|nr:hypothetical protein [Thermoflexales bacterium]
MADLTLAMVQKVASVRSLDDFHIVTANSGAGMADVLNGADIMDYG